MEVAWVLGAMDYKIQNGINNSYINVVRDDYLLWRSKASGEYSVRSGYKLLLQGSAIADFIMSYLRELDKLSKKIPVRRSEAERWRTQEWPYVKINFDAIQMGMDLGFLTVEIEGDALLVNGEQLYLQNEMPDYAMAMVERDQR
ncbi:hypothetical protein Godav_019403, partial [Gossypium davidsonii]|nr:hypothetical protein [Gossypium davidsonii]